MTQPATAARFAAIRRLSADPARSAALPGALYSDPAVFAAERQKLFFKSWQCVGHASELPNPGDYLCTRIIDQGRRDGIPAELGERSVAARSR